MNIDLDRDGNPIGREMQTMADNEKETEDLEEEELESSIEDDDDEDDVTPGEAFFNDLKERGLVAAGIDWDELSSSLQKSWEDAAIFYEQ